jgi:hypothetical protein
MPLDLEELKSVLRSLIRSIDRKADFSVAPQAGEESVSVTMALRKNKTTVVVQAQQIEAAAQDAMRRSQLRNVLKRAIDRMMFEPTPIASTKMVRGPVIEGGFFRAHPGGRR